VDGPYLIDSTREYILAFEEELNQLRDANLVEDADQAVSAEME
jgi:hypothetical protein